MSDHRNWNRIDRATREAIENELEGFILPDSRLTDVLLGPPDHLPRYLKVPDPLERAASHLFDAFAYAVVVDGPVGESETLVLARRLMCGALLALCGALELADQEGAG